MKNKENKTLIVKNIMGNSGYSLCYEEIKNEENNCIEINAKMVIDLNSKAAVNKLNKSWKNEKSPLLTELQKIYRTHLKNIKEEKTGKYYDEFTKE